MHLASVIAVYGCTELKLLFLFAVVEVLQAVTLDLNVESHGGAHCVAVFYGICSLPSSPSHTIHSVVCQHWLLE